MNEPLNQPDWITAGLSTQQRAPFGETDRDACIFAAAGSGKTKTLVQLLVADLAAGVPPASIVAFTFTEKAAEELLARIYAAAGEHLPDLSLNGLFVGTIHGWCLKYLREQPAFYNVDSLDELHVDALVTRLYDYLGLEAAYRKPFPRGAESFIADLEVFYNEHIPIADVPQHLRRPLGLFVNVLDSNRLLTFGGMIRSATAQLQSAGPLPELLRLYIDEYQDVNPAQVALATAMAGNECLVRVVGDDLQCIYQWRGSDVGRILNFEDDFPGATTHRLSENYRSRPRIVSVANAIAERVIERDRKKVMTPVRPADAVSEVHWLTGDGETEQAATVASLVSRAVAQGIKPKQIAVLLRSVTSSGREIVDALQSQGIPVNCPTLSRGADFIFEFLLPLLEWLASDRPEPSNEREAEELAQRANALYSVSQQWTTVSEDFFWRKLAEWDAVIDLQKNTAYDVRGRLYDFLDACDIKVGPDRRMMMVGLGIASQIIRSVEEIHRRRLEGQPRRSPRGQLREIVFALRRNQDSFGESVALDAGGDGVVITTVHQAKGREWPVVILPMLARRRFPLNPSGHGTSFPDEIADRYGTTTEDERRLFYVACTRAKDRLFLLDPKSGQPRDRSIFIKDLIDDGILSAPTTLDTLPSNIFSLSPEALIESAAAPLKLGLSDLLVYTECPYQFGLRRLAGLQPAVGDELGYGKGLHELIQRRLQAAEPWDDAMREEHCRNHVHLPLASAGIETESRKAIASRLADLERIGAFDATVETEVEIEVVLGTALIHGIIDVVEVLPDGRLRIRDWKSNIHEEFVQRYELQLAFYAYALNHSGRTVSEADLVDVAASAKAGRIISRQVDISPARLESLVDTLSQAVLEIQRDVFTATPTFAACGSCDLARVCACRFTAP
jgi:DNA helicase II / ATP-dependent DNA helicase PcrA